MVNKTSIIIITFVIIMVLGIIYLLGIESSRAVKVIGNEYCKDKEDGDYSYSMCDMPLEVRPFYFQSCGANVTSSVTCNNRKAEWRWAS